MISICNYKMFLINRALLLHLTSLFAILQNVQLVSSTKLETDQQNFETLSRATTSQENSSVHRNKSKEFAKCLENFKEMNNSSSQDKRNELGIRVHKFLNQPMEDFLFNPIDIIRRNGYPAEEHFATTQDGYILGLHRIPFSPFTKYNYTQGKGVILMVSGLLTSSASLVANDRENSLGFAMADAGYDVWLGNIRGSTYSRNHTKINPIHFRFWRFGYDENGEEDLPAMVSYILSHTKAKKIFYLGMSAGAKIFFTKASEDQKLQNKVRLGISLGVTTFYNPGVLSLPRGRQSSFLQLLFRASELLRIGQFLDSPHNLVTMGRRFCRASENMYNICATLLKIIFSLEDEGFLRPNEFEKFIRIFSGGSIKQMASAYNGRVGDPVHKFDYGNAVENLLRYGRQTPPVYDMSRVRIPIAYYWSVNDMFTPLEDVRNQLRSLPNVVHNYKVPDERFTHFDFLLHPNSRQLFINDVIDIMSKF